MIEIWQKYEDSASNSLCRADIENLQYGRVYGHVYVGAQQNFGRSDKNRFAFLNIFSVLHFLECYVFIHCISCVPSSKFYHLTVDICRNLVT